MGCGASRKLNLVNDASVVLVTGGTGLVGRALQELAKKHTGFKFVFVGSKDADLTMSWQVTTLFEQVKPDYVIHLAARVGGLFRNMHEPVEMLEANLAMNQNVVSACHMFKVKKLIACLSTCVFPEGAPVPLTEAMLHAGPPHSSNAAYAYAKRVLDVHCAAYRAQHDSPFMCVIPTNLFGPHDQFDLHDAHVIPALIHKCYLAKKTNTTFDVRGTGQALRQFVFARDFAERLIWCLLYANPRYLTRVIVASDEQVSIRDVVDHIVAELEFKGPVMWDGDLNSDGQKIKTADGSVLQRHCGLRWTSFQEGLEETIDWFVREVESDNPPRGAKCV